LENPSNKYLLQRLIGFGLFSQLALILMLFGIPGRTHYWQGWSFAVVNFIVSIVLSVYFYKYNRDLLARRLLRKEKVVAQKVIIYLMKIVCVSVYLLSVYDNHLGWSQTYLAPVPWWLTWIALLAFAGCNLLFIPVFNANPFAASVIQVEAQQIVAEKGPYRLVRHPMYSVLLAAWFWTPLALGSYFALPVAALLLPVLVLRLLNEEKFLRHELPGYAEYCQRTPYRLIPFVW
jgi:protein-S-isoprenylcysteine O-methyltransferase Ste14